MFKTLSLRLFFSVQNSSPALKQVKRIRTDNEVGLESVGIAKKNTNEFVTTYNMWY
jgi:hypothetical protein